MATTTIKGKNSLINSLTGIQQIKDASGNAVETKMNTDQIMGYFITALIAFIVYKIAPGAKDWVSNLFG